MTVLQNIGLSALKATDTVQDSCAVGCDNFGRRNVRYVGKILKRGMSLLLQGREAILRDYSALRTSF